MQIFHEERNIILEYKISWLFWFWQKCIMHNIESIKEYFVSTIQPYKDKTLLIFKTVPGLLPGCWKEGKNLSDLKSIRGEWGGGGGGDGWQTDTKNSRKLKTNIFPGQESRLNINHLTATNIFTDQSTILTRSQL